MKKTCLFLLLSISVSAQTSIEKARKLYEERKPAEAKKILSGIKDDDKEFAAAQYYQGRIAFDEKNYDDAQEFFEEAEQDGGFFFAEFTGERRALRPECQDPCAGGESSAGSAPVCG